MHNDLIRGDDLANMTAHKIEKKIQAEKQSGVLAKEPSSSHDKATSTSTSQEATELSSSTLHENKKPISVPPLFGARNNLVYFHSHTCTPDILNDAVDACPLFEIDLAWAHTAFNSAVTMGSPFIGHPEEFYTLLGEEKFPEGNVTLEQFLRFMNNNLHIKLFSRLLYLTVYSSHCPIP